MKARRGIHVYDKDRSLLLQVCNYIDYTKTKDQVILSLFSVTALPSTSTVELLGAGVCVCVCVCIGGEGFSRHEQPKWV